MNPQDAHQIANEEILKLIEGCRGLYNGVTEHDECYSLITNGGVFINNLCPVCLNKLKGILSSQEKEIEFLTSEFFIYLGIDNKYQTIKVRKRLEALKISCQDLRRVLK